MRIVRRVSGALEIQIPMATKRIIFEHGVTLELGKRRATIQSAVSPRLPTARAISLIKDAGFKPVIYVLSHPTGIEIPWLKTPDGRDVNDILLRSFHQGLPVTDILHEFNRVQYYTGGVVFHLRRLAILYSEIAAHFAKRKPAPELLIYCFAFQEAVYYELDGALTKLKTAYDSLGWLVHKRYSSGRCPDYLPECIAKPNVPAALRSSLQGVWDASGKPANDYRNCIIHRTPLNVGMSHTTMEPIANDAWATWIELPVNPRARKATNFKFRPKLDGLTYIWGAATAYLDVMDSTMKAVKQP